MGGVTLRDARERSAAKRRALRRELSRSVDPLRIPPPHGRRKPGAGGVRFDVRKRDRDHPQGCARPLSAPNGRVAPNRAAQRSEPSGRALLDLPSTEAHIVRLPLSPTHPLDARHQALTTRRVHLRKETCMPASTSGGAARRAALFARMSTRPSNRAVDLSRRPPTSTMTQIARSPGHSDFANFGVPLSPLTRGARGEIEGALCASSPGESPLQLVLRAWCENCLTGLRS